MTEQAVARLKAFGGEAIAGDGAVNHPSARDTAAGLRATQIGGTPTRPTFSWKVDAARRRKLERTRLGRRVFCPTRKLWSTERIVHAFRGQWNVEELFRRSKRGCVVPWGPSYQWADTSLQLHSFATVLRLTLVALAKLAPQRKGTLAYALGCENLLGNSLPPSRHATK